MVFQTRIEKGSIIFTSRFLLGEEGGFSFETLHFFENRCPLGCN